MAAPRSASGDEAPERTHRYLFSSIGSNDRFEVLVARRWLVMLLPSLGLLLAGLALIYVPSLRHPRILLSAACLLLLVVLIWPDAAVLAAEAASFGLGLAPLAAVLRRIVSGRGDQESVARIESPIIERSSRRIRQPMADDELVTSTASIAIAADELGRDDSDPTTESGLGFRGPVPARAGSHEQTKCPRRSCSDGLCRRVGDLVGAGGDLCRCAACGRPGFGNSRARPTLQPRKCRTGPTIGVRTAFNGTGLGISASACAGTEDRRLVPRRSAIPSNQSQGVERLAQQAASAAKRDAAPTEIQLTQAIDPAIGNDALVAGQALLEIENREKHAVMLSLEPCRLSIDSPRWSGGTSDSKVSRDRLGGAVPLALGIRANGKLAIRVAESGRLRFGWTLRGQREAGGALTFSLQLPPCPSTRLELLLPPDLIPVADQAIVTPMTNSSTGDECATSANEAVSGDERPMQRWQIELGDKICLYFGSRSASCFTKVVL